MWRYQNRKEWKRTKNGKELIGDRHRQKKGNETSEHYDFEDTLRRGTLSREHDKSTNEADIELSIEKEIDLKEIDEFLDKVEKKTEGIIKSNKKKKQNNIDNEENIGCQDKVVDDESNRERNTHNIKTTTLSYMLKDESRGKIAIRDNGKMQCPFC